MDLYSWLIPWTTVPAASYIANHLKFPFLSFHLHSSSNRHLSRWLIVWIVNLLLSVFHSSHYSFLQHHEQSATYLTHLAVVCRRPLITRADTTDRRADRTPIQPLSTITRNGPKGILHGRKPPDAQHYAAIINLNASPAMHPVVIIVSQPFIHNEQWWPYLIIFGLQKPFLDNYFLSPLQHPLGPAHASCVQARALKITLPIRCNSTCVEQKKKSICTVLGAKSSIKRSLLPRSFLIYSPQQ